ncbi:hypothetical protein VTJ04DRAFT_9805 [Mycothermus thermophilus]|uniref:uncharacterized protein n=1 Tax=Humicola insolens TaxID=85995 RepID=UPI003742822E
MVRSAAGTSFDIFEVSIAALEDPAAAIRLHSPPVDFFFCLCVFFCRHTGQDFRISGLSLDFSPDTAKQGPTPWKPPWCHVSQSGRTRLAPGRSQFPTSSASLNADSPKFLEVPLFRTHYRGPLRASNQDPDSPHLDGASPRLSSVGSRNRSPIAAPKARPDPQSPVNGRPDPGFAILAS